VEERFRTEPARSTGELRAAYNALHKGGALTQLTSFYIWVLSLLSPKAGSRLLDISCGSGVLLQAGESRGLRAYGVDLSDRAVLETNTRLRANRAVVADAEALPFPEGAFEFVTNLGSIEHYLHPERGAAEIARVLSAEGRACVLLPNSYSLLENVWSVLRTGEVGDQGQPVERYATRAEWERMLAENGLSVYKTAGYNLAFPRTLPDWWWYIRRPRRVLWLVASLCVPLNLSGCFAFLCRKRDTDTGGYEVS